MYHEGLETSSFEIDSFSAEIVIITELSGIGHKHNLSETPEQGQNTACGLYAISGLIASLIWH